METLAQEKAVLIDRRFGLVFAGIFLTIFGIRWIVAGSLSLWSLITAVCFLAASVAAPGVLMPLNRLWHGIADRLGIAVNYLVLGVVFYGVICPSGAIMRLLRHDPMSRNRSEKSATYFSAVMRRTDAETFVDQF